MIPPTADSNPSESPTEPEPDDPHQTEHDRAKAPRNFYGPIISDYLKSSPTPPVPPSQLTLEQDQRLMNKTLERVALWYQVKKLVRRREKERRDKVGRKKLKLSKALVAILEAARLTPTQEKYWRLHIEYGLGPTAIARMFERHPSTIVESLRAANTKINGVKSGERRR